MSRLLTILWMLTFVGVAHVGVAHVGVAHAGVMCNDGTQSPTCTYVHSGCCSWHGGVAYQAPSYTYAPAPTPVEPEWEVLTVTRGCNARVLPSTTSKVRRTLPPGSLVIGLRSNTDPWLLVLYPITGDPDDVSLYDFMHEICFE